MLPRLPKELQGVAFFPHITVRDAVLSLHWAADKAGGVNPTLFKGFVWLSDHPSLVTRCEPPTPVPLVASPFRQKADTEWTCCTLALGNRLKCACSQIKNKTRGDIPCFREQLRRQHAMTPKKHPCLVSAWLCRFPAQTASPLAPSQV